MSGPGLTISTWFTSRAAGPCLQPRPSFEASAQSVLDTSTRSFQSVQPFIESPRLLWPLLTSLAASSQPFGSASFIAPPEISPGNAQRPPRLCPPHVLPQLAYKNWTLSLLAPSSAAAASYVISVRRTSVLPAASFGFPLTEDTVRLALPLAGCALDFNQPVTAPCRAHQRERLSVAFRQTLSPDVGINPAPEFRLPSAAA
jgi:hypothetical protein